MKNIKGYTVINLLIVKGKIMPSYFKRFTIFFCFLFLIGGLSDLPFVFETPLNAQTTPELLTTKPNLVSPMNEGVIGVRPVFQWEAVPGATYYTLVICYASGCQSQPQPVPNPYVTTDTSFTLDQDLPFDSYVWWIQAHQENISSLWSDSGLFSVSNPEEETSGWLSLSQKSHTVLIATVIEPTYYIKQPDATVIQIRLPDNSIRYRLKTSSVNYLTRFRVETIGKSDGRVKPGKTIEVFTETSFGFENGERYLLYLRNPFQLADRFQDRNGWKRLYGTVRIDPESEEATPFNPSEVYGVTYSTLFEPNGVQQISLENEIEVDETLDLIEAASSPHVTLMSSDRILKEQVQLTAEAKDDLGVKEVEFILDGSRSLGIAQAKLGTLPIFPTEWNSRNVPDGHYHLTALAKDYVGQTGESESIEVVVDNTPPLLSITPDIPEFLFQTGELITVRIEVEATDMVTPEPEVQLLSIECQDCNPESDIIEAELGTDDRVFQLREGLLGQGEQRRYPLTYLARDEAGHETRASTVVVGPICDYEKTLGCGYNYAYINNGSVAFQSSTWDEEFNGPSRAIDGDISEIYRVAMTRQDFGQYWQVDLGEPQRIHRIEAWKANEGRVFTSHFRVEVDPTDCSFESYGGDHRTVARFQDQPMGRPSIVEFEPQWVRCVRLTTEDNQHMRLGEVKVSGLIGDGSEPICEFDTCSLGCRGVEDCSEFSCGKTNLCGTVCGAITDPGCEYNYARYGGATLSSTWNPEFTGASRAINGEVNNPNIIAMSQQGHGQYWQVNLGSPKQIHRIRAWRANHHHGGWFDNFIIHADPDDCRFDGDHWIITHYQNQALARPSVFNFTPRTIQCVRVSILEDDHLRLHELEVIGIHP